MPRTARVLIMLPTVHHIAWLVLTYDSGCRGCAFGGCQLGRPPLFLVVLIDGYEDKNKTRVIDRLHKAPEAKRQYNIANALCQPGQLLEMLSRRKATTPVELGFIHLITRLGHNEIDRG